MQVRIVLAAVFLVACAAIVRAQDVTVKIEDKTITPATGAFTLAITVTNTTEAAIPISGVDFQMVFSPNVAGNINFLNADMDDAFPWTPSSNPGSDSLLTDHLNITASSGTNSLLDPGDTDLMVLNLELKQPGPEQVKYDITFDYYFVTNTNGATIAEGFPGFNDEGTAGSIAVPEPGSVMAIGSLAGLLLMRRRRAA